VHAQLSFLAPFLLSQVTTLDLRFDCGDGSEGKGFGDASCGGTVGYAHKFSSIIFTSDTTFYYATTHNLFEMSLTPLPPAK
jgi:hypothetical protein